MVVEGFILIVVDDKDVMKRSPTRSSLMPLSPPPTATLLQATITFYYITSMTGELTFHGKVGSEAFHGIVLLASYHKDIK